VVALPPESLIGALAATHSLPDGIGRKKTIIPFGLLNRFFPASVQVVSFWSSCIVVGRIISGVSVGLTSALVPIFYPWSSITWGILIQFGCNGVASFRIPWGLQTIPGIILSLGMTVFPESPRWLFDNEEEALQVLADLHGKGDKHNALVQLEYRYLIRIGLEGAKSYLDRLKHGNPRRFFLSSALQMWSQLSCMNIMIYYIIYVLQGAGLTGRRADLIPSNCLQFISIQSHLLTPPKVPAILYIDKWGRRLMLLVGALLMGFFFYLVGGLQGRFGQWGANAGERNWAFNTALAFAVPPGLATIAWKTYFIFGTFNFATFILS
ncbi:hypothetical protein M378DRAFT_90750, partial [Amanita muscaria Koide BX008]